MDPKKLAGLALLVGAGLYFATRAKAAPVPAAVTPAPVDDGVQPDTDTDTPPGGGGGGSGGGTPSEPEPPGPQFSHPHVVLWEHENFTGVPLYLDEDTPRTNPLGFNDRASSIQIFGLSEVTIYADDNYQGRSARITRSHADLRQLGFGDTISSVRFPAPPPAPPPTTAQQQQESMVTPSTPEAPTGGGYAPGASAPPVMPSTDLAPDVTSGSDLHYLPPQFRPQPELPGMAPDPNPVLWDDPAQFDRLDQTRNNLP